MWALRILNGPQAGQIYVLKQGKTKIGRSSGAQFQVNVPGISKEHVELTVSGDKIVISDLKSSNGTFVNGVRVQSAIVRLGDKLSLDKILFDVILAPQTQSNAVVSTQVRYPAQAGTSTHYPTALSTNAGYQTQAGPGGMPSMAPPQQQSSDFDFDGGMQSAPVGFQQKTERYVNEVVLPSLYQMTEVFDFKVVMFGFAGVFVLLVTLLSVIPMNQITSESIKTESRRRALTVARALANANEKAIRSGEMTGYSADIVLRDEGISNVYILAKDGSIMAPPEMAGMSPKGDVAGFAVQIKGQIKEMSAEIGSTKIGASAPILVFDPELQQNVAKAHAVVVYDTGSLAFDDGRALSLFIQMLMIALVLGGGLFWLMYKLIEYPMLRLTQELDGALREGRDQVQVGIRFPVFQKVLVTVNSLLTRVSQGGGASPAAGGQLQDQEWMNLVQLVGYPAMLLTKELTVVSINQNFESITGVNASSLQGQPLQYLPDQAMQKNIEELAKSSGNSTFQVQSDKLDISGTMFRLQCQAITVNGDAKFFLVTISPDDLAQGGAA